MAVSSTPLGAAAQPPASLSPSERARLVRAGVRVEAITVGWMAIEAAIAIGAGIAARSVLLTAFGLDSIVELVTGGVLLWRLSTESRAGALDRVEAAERRAAWVAAFGLVALCAYVMGVSVIALLMHHHPDTSFTGIALALAATAGMPLLAREKRRIAARIGSTALRGDAACSITCAYMAGALLAGLVLTAAFGWWWADSLAALGLLYWLVPKAREALAGARAGRSSCACIDDDCHAD
jgi:divalent metal cation (Fe/Co/Zn/Cd) transporter